MLIGREREVAHIEGLLDAARRGESSALLVTGDAGIGKSALLGEAGERAQALGIRVLRTRGFESESDIAFAGLLELLTPLLGLRDRIPEVQAAALGSALALEPPSPHDRFAVPAGMLSLLGAAAEDGPVLALVDDVHWLDPASREAIAFVARRLGAEGVVLLCGSRPAAGVLEAFAGVEARAVGGLADAAAHRLLRQAAGDRLADDVAARLVDEAQGNPLALVEVPRALSAAQLAGREPMAGPVPAGATIERAFAQQLAMLEPETRSALLVASAVVTRRADLLSAALERLGVPAAAMRPAELAGLVRVDGRIEFFHPLLRSVVYHGAEPAERRAVHATLAELATHPGRRAWHLAAAAGAPDERVAAELEAAARDARTRGGTATAAHAFERAAELSTDDLARGRRLLEAAADHAEDGRADHALDLVGRARDLAVGDALTTEIVRATARVDRLRGDPLASHHVLMAEAERIEHSDPATSASLLVEAAVTHMLTGDMEALIAAGDRARELLPDGADPVLAVLAGVMVGVAHAALGHEDEADALLDPVVPVLLGGQVLAAPGVIVGMVGHCGVWYERWDRAERVLDRLVAAGREASAISHLIYPLAAHAVLDLRRGRWAGALADASEATGLARETANRPLLVVALGIQAQIEAAMGRRDDARAHAREVLTLCQLLGGPVMSVYAHAALGLDALAAGDAGVAAEHLDRAAHTGRRLRMQRGLVQYGADRVEAHVRLGAIEEAHRALEEFADRPGGGRWALAALARCRGLLADDGWEDHFETALAHHQHDGQPFEQARTQLAYGERLRRGRRRADAREQLTAALDCFDRLGAAPWSERARMELRATGGTAPENGVATDAQATALADLTAHELQIARLVAYGLTNREVAAKLFLSPKTIEYHLSQIYRKLDLRGRAQLAKLMASELPNVA